MQKINTEDRNTIRHFYEYHHFNVFFVETIGEIIKFFLVTPQNTIFASPNRVIRKIAKLRNLRVISTDNLVWKAEEGLAILDALKLLAKKKVPVYFYNRIGKEKNKYTYSKTAQIRMQKKLSFPIMYENQDLFEKDLKELFGDLYDKEYIQQIGKIPQVIQKGDTYCHEDFSSQYVNVVQGKRVTHNQPQSYKKTIHIYGRCGVFGYAVEDKDTLPSQIQRLLLEKGLSDYRVINHGLWGGSNEYIDHNFLNECIGMKEGDIVLFYRMHIDKTLLKTWEEIGVWYKELTHEWHQRPEAKWCFYDKPGHMNNIGYKITADLIVQDLIAHDFSCKDVEEKLFIDFSSKYLNIYLKNRKNPAFYKEIEKYTSNILNQYPPNPLDQECGSIVMNCNPFTLGHRYLIEIASKQVDRLYIFVVEEDKSFFKYSDRFEMVKQGVADLKNIVVVPSGKFIISSLTFPEYFMKDYVKEKNFDVTMDLEVFCKYIAKPLNIKKRFAGEEPFDPVTSNYNDNMKRILPQFGMEFCEIPRLSNNSGKVINATEVRRLLKNKDYNEIKKYVPQSTLKILLEKYSDDAL